MSLCRLAAYSFTQCMHVCRYAVGHLTDFMFVYICKFVHSQVVYLCTHCMFVYRPAVYSSAQCNYVHPLGGGHIIFAFSAVRCPTWFPDILGNSSYPIFTKFGMQVYWVNSLYGIAFGDDSSIAN